MIAYARGAFIGVVCIAAGVAATAFVLAALAGLIFAVAALVGWADGWTDGHGAFVLALIAAALVFVHYAGWNEYRGSRR